MRLSFGESGEKEIGRIPKFHLTSQGIAIFIGFAGLFCAAAILSPTFLKPTNLFNLARQAGPLAIVSVGQTFAILAGGIDLSVGSIISLTSCILCTMMMRGDAWTLPSILVALLMGSLIGLINGLIVTLRRIPPFVVTLGMMTIVQGVALIYTGGYPTGRVSPVIQFIGAGRFGPFPILTLLALLVVLISLFILRKTTFGRYTYAIGANENAAYLSGIKTLSQKLGVYTLCGFMAAVAGISLAARLTVGDPFVGQGFELDSIAAVVMGGTSLSGGIGGLGGTVLGVLIISTINNLLNLLNVSGFYQHVVKGIVIIISITLYKGRS
ncbi:MAG: ABC transporter permease [Deltaproteobacteria bacterium]|nr:ABC transporter permease [Deltaproteobacteria bacterium]